MIEGNERVASPASSEQPTGLVDTWLGTHRPLDDVDLHRGRLEVMDRLFSDNGGALTVGRYVLERRIGSGGFGTVYLAHDPELDRRVAIKMVRRSDGPGRSRTGLLREARAIAKLEHPNIVKVHDVVDRSKAVHIVMEFVEGQPLLSWMKPRRSWRETCRMFVQAGAALAHAHDEGLSHRDFKPSNVMVDNEGRAVVLDFGLARFRGDAASLDVMGRCTTSAGSNPAVGTTDDGMVVGTLGYMPPERLFGDDLGSLSDQYSYCVTLFEALFGQRPFRGTNAQAIQHAQQQGLRLTAGQRRRTPAWLRRILARGLAYQARQRFASMQALVEELRRGLGRRRRRARVSAALALAGLSAAAALWASGRARRCTTEAAAAQLDAAWGEQRRAAVRDAMLATHASYGEVAWSMTQEVLDTYADDWTRMHVEACKAATVRKEQSDALMNARMACLRRAKTDLDATVDVLAAADAETVRNAHSVTRGLGPLERCEDLEALARPDGLPPASEADVVEAIRGHLARARAAERAGDYPRARDDVDKANALLAEVGFELAHVESAVVEGWVLQQLGDYDAAETKLRFALRQASALRHWDLLHESASSLLWLLGVRREAFDEALRYGDMAQALAQGDRQKEVMTALRMGGVLYKRGELSKAAAQYRGVLEDGAARPTDPLARTNLAMILNAQGDFDAAAHQYRQAIATLETQLGREHPLVGKSRVGYATALQGQGKFTQAAAELRAALALLEETLGPGNPTTATARASLANALVGEGELAQAEAEYRDILASLEPSLRHDHSLVTAARSNLGAVLGRQGKHADAEAVLRRLLASHGGDQRTAAHAHAHCALAESLHAQGRLEEAETEYLQALVVYDADGSELGADHPVAARTRSRLAALYLDLGDPDAARRPAQLAWDAQRGRSFPLAAGETAFILARALDASEVAEDRTRAVDLAKEALTRYQDGDAPDDEIAQIVTWLEHRRARPRPG